MNRFILIIDGPMGSGKSTVGELVQKKLKRTALLSIDRIKWFISDFKRSQRDNAITTAVLSKMYDEYLNQGINLIVTQGFWQGAGTPFNAPNHFAALAKRYKAKFHYIQLDAPKEILLKRIEKRKTQVRTPIAKSRVMRNIKMWKSSKYPSDKIFDTQKMSAANVAKEILREISKK